MKTVLKLSVFCFCIMLLTTSCRDKGAFTWSGNLIDSCNGGYLVGTEVSTYYNGVTQRYTTDAQGYFKLSGKWNKPCNIPNCKPVEPELNIEYFDPYWNTNRVISLRLPEGNTDFEDIVLFDTLHFSIRVDTSAKQCLDCELSMWMYQQSLGVQFNPVSMQYGNPAFDVKITQPISYYRNSSVPNNSVLLDFWLYDRTSKQRYEYDAIDITDKIRRCSEVDTIILVP